MKPIVHGRWGFTLVELLAVMAIVTILAMLLLPVLGNTQAKARRIQCLSNLRQTGIGFHSFLQDHDNGFPMQISTNAGGTLETLVPAYLSAAGFYFSYVHFQSLSNDLDNPRIFTCPSDPARTPGDEFPRLSNKNISYFVGANADYSLANSILAGDRNIVSIASGQGPALVRLSDSTPANWTRQLHGLKGNELFADGHVERVNGRAVKLPLRNAPAMMDLMLPLLAPSRPAPSALARADGCRMDVDPGGLLFLR
jgi:prepilin-type N-terminal cleavage/methylation domain-containing protein/prepilin-type processing-associated H-X9-DG protein